MGLGSPAYCLYQLRLLNLKALFTERDLTVKFVFPFFWTGERQTCMLLTSFKDKTWLSLALKTTLPTIP